MPKSRYYKILGLTPNATEQEVRKQYRQLVKQFHPDRNSAPNAQEKFILITEAYDVLLGKKALPGSHSSGTPTNEQEREERMKKARKRYAEQVIKEKLEDERYYRYLTEGRKWKHMRWSAIIGILFSLLTIADFFLPHHYEEDQVTHYSHNVASGPNGQLISLVKTAKNDHYWISKISYTLYAKTRNIYVESSWIFHNPIRIISREKLQYKVFDIHFTFYHAAWLMLVIFLLPGITMLYKRKKISFTFLFYTSYYFVNALLLIYFFTGNRWAHVLTLGFL